MNYKLAWCALCQDYHRPPQPQNHKMFHTDPFATRYIPHIPDQSCRHCHRPIRYDRTWGGWIHLGWFQSKGCAPVAFMYGEPEPRNVT